MNTIEYTLAVTAPSLSQKLSLAGAGVAVVTAAPMGFDTVVVTPMVDCFVRKSATANATADGTDQLLVAKNTYRLFGIAASDRLSFNGATAGDIYLTPGA